MVVSASEGGKTRLQSIPDGFLVEVQAEGQTLSGAAAGSGPTGRDSSEDAEGDGSDGGDAPGGVAPQVRSDLEGAERDGSGDLRG
jgi:hypothetical protein